MDSSIRERGVAILNLKIMKHCTSCGALHADDPSLFCLRCGGGTLTEVGDDLPFSSSMMEYTYKGDKISKSGEYAGRQCRAVRRPDGKCIRGRNSNMLVQFDTGESVVVLARMLRKNNKT